MTKRRRRKQLGSLVRALIFVLGYIIISFWAPLLLLPESQWIPEQQNLLNNIIDHQPLSEISCEVYGGPHDASEMVYWKDYHSSDAAYMSPFAEPKTKYLTFEPDKGGWNNVRMNLETVLVMAHAMGRTLVMVCGLRQKRIIGSFFAFSH